MITIKLKVKNCKDCPFLVVDKVQTGDSWDEIRKWTCSKSEKVVDDCVDWWSQNFIEIPNWCEIKEN